MNQCQKKINLSLFEDIFELLPLANAKMLININNAYKQRNCSRGKRQNIKFKRQHKKNEQKRKKYKNVDKTLEIIKKILDYNKDVQNIFQHASKVDKGKSEPEGSIAKRTILRKGMVAEIEKEEKNIDYKLFNRYFTNYQLISKIKKNIALANLSIYYTWKNIKSENKNNKFKISAATWNNAFDLPDGSYSISDIQDYFEFIIKKHETLAENPPIQIYPNKVKNRIVFKIKTGYKLELLTPETMRLLESTKKDADADKNSENVPKLEPVEVVLVHCKLYKNDYKH